MKLAILTLASFALALVPTAAADTVACQPTPAGSACAIVWTGTYGATGAQACLSTPLYACAGAAHIERTGYTANVVGAVVCVALTVCVANSPGQYNYGGRFMVGDENYVYTPAGYVLFQGYVGSYNNAPWHAISICPSTVVTGGTCLLV